jgi:hypothetical protein
MQIEVAPETHRQRVFTLLQNMYSLHDVYCVAVHNGDRGACQRVQVYWLVFSSDIYLLKGIA